MEVFKHSAKEPTIDKVTMTEYTMLPGIVSDRFYNIAVNKRHDTRIAGVDLINLLTRVFCGKFQEKMSLTFQMFDFNGDGFITAEDVRLVLSYIPFKTSMKKVVTKNNSESSSDSECSISSKEKEGMYSKTGVKAMDTASRQQTSEEIKKFVDTVFSESGRSKMDFLTYQDLNTNVSSEMFLSIMSVLHENLPCAAFYFRQKRLFK